MPTNSVSMTDHLVAMSSAGARDGRRPDADTTELTALVSALTPEYARDAYLRFTASNRWPNQAPPPTEPGLWGRITRPRIVRFPDNARTANPWPYGAERTPAHGELAGESTLLRPEAELLGIAVLLVERIKASPAARSHVITAGQILPQVDQSLYTISHQGYRIWWVRSSIEYPESDSDVGRALTEAINQRLARVQHNWRELLDNVAQLAELATNFDSYAKVLRDHERHQRLLAHGDTVGTSWGRDTQWDRLQWDHLQGMQANLSAQIGFINDTARRVSSVDLG
ncbi:hypothetical protein V1Y59_18275 [Gordonia sp. PKS22-38]|uniref:Uncharacterized protein n=1 Tax=Gordonia prachuapensis TaxID=3115651 RepID=A0ABU7MXH7_9ACTN|nr:hypothetical protein [Gordonia sp. PKS22-38]